MIIKSSQWAVIGGMLLFAASTASQAAMMETDPNLVVGTENAFYVGSVEPGIPAGQSNEESYVNNLITLAAGAGPDSSFGDGQTYDRRQSNLLATFTTAVFAFKDDSADNINNTTTVTDGVVQYILGKYGQGISHVWYHEEGFKGTITVQGTFGGNNLSHISGFNRDGDTEVPAPPTLLLLGFGLAALGFGLRRRSS